MVLVRGIQLCQDIVEPCPRERQVRPDFAIKLYDFGEFRASLCRLARRRVEVHHEKRTRGTLPRDLELLNGAGTVAGMSDAELLCRFCSRQGDASELAFTALVARHGPMVWDVCRQILREPNDADDAFQATFLVLVRKAHSLRFTDSLGPWLYGVACRVAVKARANVGKLRRREQLCVKALEHVPEKECRDLGSVDSAFILYEELGRLQSSIEIRSSSATWRA